MNSANRKNTKAVDGYRWTCNEWNGVFKATPQQRCTTDTGAVYYRYCQPKAEFDTPEARDKFVASFSAKEWAK